MTLAQARADLLARARLDLDLYKGIELDSNGNAVEESVGLTDLISRACIWWATLTRWNYSMSIPLTLTAVANAEDAVFDLRDKAVVGQRVLKPQFVIVNGVRLRRPCGGAYGLWSVAELGRYRPYWRNMAAGEPSAAIWLSTNKLLLSAPPSEAFTGKNFVEGWVLPDDLQAGADDDLQLPAPEEDHSAIVSIAQAFGMAPMLSESEAWNRLAEKDAHWREAAERRIRESNRTHIGSGPSGQMPDW